MTESISYTTVYSTFKSFFNHKVQQLILFASGLIYDEPELSSGVHFQCPDPGKSSCRQLALSLHVVVDDITELLAYDSEGVDILEFDRWCLYNVNPCFQLFGVLEFRILVSVPPNTGGEYELYLIEWCDRRICSFLLMQCLFQCMSLLTVCFKQQTSQVFLRFRPRNCQEKNAKLYLENIYLVRSKKWFERFKILYES